MDQSAPQRPVAGVLWMLFAGFCFVAVNALVKYLGPRIPAVESAFLRYLFGLVFLLPLVPRMFAEPIAPRLWAQFVTRGVLHAAGVALWFYAMARIALADVTAINFLSPIYVTIGAAFFLGEKLAFRRIAAIVLALIGAAIILRPGLREISAGHWAMMLAALVFGGSYLLAKITVDKSNPALVVGMLSVFVTVALAPFAVTHWVQPTLWEFAVLAGVAAFATVGHYAMSLAFAVAPVSVTQPVTFLQLVWAAILGLIVFGEPLDAWVMAGGALIMGSVSFITWREARLKRRPVTPVVNATKL
ncbi:DMT family transporter [Arenibacterium halophilum]|uniref:DMT family transporter n=1 Tax=Arenibacterium halophilum TaxID=2583821 RepID=A0ABY2XD49_9RHOB|nr:DMT family transporter [Arenibacterium halophilum]TMV14894.1 DMT family transporter [Arenibacterium halophilum]